MKKACVGLHFYLPADLNESLRNAVAAIPGSRITWEIQDAVRDHVARLQRIHDAGGQFPRRRGRRK